VRTAPEGLAAALRRGLPAVCLVTGDEPLLIGEACDLLRRQARAEGFEEREVHFIDRSFDWNALLSGAANLSLFASRRIIELRLSSAPDAESARTLAALAEHPPEDALLIVSGVLEYKSLKTAWVAAFERHGCLVVAREVPRSELPRWIRGRLAERGLQIEGEAAELIADRVEGNLLAAQQEVERIALLMPGQKLDVAAVAQIVSDSARYDIFELAAAAFSGRATRALRILSGLRAEGREPPLLLWAILSDLRALSRVRHHLETQGGGLDQAFRAEKVWSSRQAPIAAALRRLDAADVDALLLRAMEVDRLTKGAARGDPWVALEGLVADVAGARRAA
jgi:DNA polymerase-3 subunit delta